MTKKTTPSNDDERLDALDSKLDSLQAAEKAEEAKIASKFAKNENMGDGMRAGFELVVTTCVGGFIGLQLDKYFETKPLFLITFLMLGIGAGFWSIYRITQGMDSSVGTKGKTNIAKDEEKR